MNSIGTQVNIGILIGFAAIVGVGMLATAELLTGEYAREAIAFLLGGGAVYGGRKIVENRGSLPPD